MANQEIQNEQIKSYSFLKEMSNDDYFPNAVVNKGKNLLLDLCLQIEAEKPANLEELYKLTHLVTDKFNDLQEDFEENGSEIETTARECIALDLEYIGAGARDI
jgi:hypothetical protein